MGSELFHADGQTNMTKLIVAFRNFANAPENVTALDRLFGLWTHCAGLPVRVRFDLRISLSPPLASHSACHSLHPTGQQGSVVCGVFLPWRCFKDTQIFTPTPPVFLRGMVHLDKAKVILPLGGGGFSTPVQPAPGIHFSHRVSFPAVKQPRRVEHHPPQLTQELSYTSTCLCAFMACYGANFLKLDPLPAVKTYGRGGIAPLILNFGNKCR